MDGQGCQLCNPLNVDVTSKGKNLKIIMIILWVINLVLLGLQIGFQEYGRMTTSIIELILLSLLCFLHYPIFACFVTFYTFFNLVFNITFLALRLQNHVKPIPGDEYLEGNRKVIWLELFALIYHIILLVMSFLAWREFFAIQKGEPDTNNFLNANINSDNLNNNNNGYNDNEDSVPINQINSSNRRGYQPFSGEGYRVGGN